MFNPSTRQEGAATPTAKVEMLFRLDGIDVSAWVVLSTTPKTFQVVKAEKTHFEWKRTVKSADLGVDWFVTLQDALRAGIERKKQKIEYVKDELQRQRTYLGMLESQLAKAEGQS